VELTGDRVRLSFGTILHFVPFLIIIFCSLTFGSLLRGSPTVNFLNSHPRLPFIIFWILAVVQFSCYQYFIHSKWRLYQNIIRQEVSNTEDVSISWVRFFMSVFLVVNISFLLSLLAVIHLDVMNLVWKSVGIVFSLSIFALGYKGILQREIFYSDSVIPAPPVEPPSMKEENPNTEVIDNLLAFMRDKKPFLDPELSLSSLSKQIGLNRNQLSRLINEGIGENFYDFINRYRVDEVKRLMTDPQKQNYNLLGIALEAGFKSKSTFNLIFKRFTGLTPTEYKKNIT
jgi:AraC-like DNA-binding protein